MTTKIADIYRTKDFSIFKNLRGNRKDAAIRSKKVSESIKKNGYILSPICVNENYEVIDGQARLVALNELGMPVDYYFAPGASITDCIAMNIYGTKWTITDYIDSYADMGNENYLILQRIVKEFAGKLHLLVILQIVRGVWGSTATSSIKEGTFVVDKQNIEKKEKSLGTLCEIKDHLRFTKGNIDYFLLAYNFIDGQLPNIDIERLRNRIEIMAGDIKPAVSIKSALASLSDIYNWKLQPDKRVYFGKEYDQYLCRVMATYRKRWSDKDK